MSEERAEYTAGEQKKITLDPLTLALRAVQSFEQNIIDYEAEGLHVGLESLYKKAQLRTLWALAAEVRALRFVMEGDDDAQADS